MRSKLNFPSNPKMEKREKAKTASYKALRVPHMAGKETKQNLNFQVPTLNQTEF